MSASRRREMLVVVAIGCALVVARGAVFLFYEGSFFDSDQAIVGLMAKHLVEGRAFPLFYYGLPYLLGVDAWVAAPFFLVAGPTVAALRASLIFTNLAAVTLLIAGLVRYCRLTPWSALVPAAFFAFAPPYTAAWLVAAGANAGPFVWVILLWMLVDRPLLFGAILALGFLHREFTIYAVPLLLIGQARDRSLFRSDRLRSWLLAGVGFLAIWQAVETLKPLADPYGPGTRGQIIQGAARSQLENILLRVGVDPADLWHRAVVMIADFFPREIGARTVPSTTAAQGRDWLRWPIELGLLVAAVRALVVQRRLAPESRPRFAWYLAGVGALCAGAYVLTRPATDVVDRYLLLTLYLPVGVTAAFLAVEPRAAGRWAMTALVATWATVSAIDHGRLLIGWRHAPPYELRQLVDGLLARNIHVAKAQYWRAYNVTFLSQERIKVASSDEVRIDEYQRLAAAEGKNLIVLSEMPCAGEKFLYWYLCRSLK